MEDTPTVTVEHVRNSLGQIDRWLDAIGKALTNDYPGAIEGVASARLKIEDIRAVIKDEQDDRVLGMPHSAIDNWTAGPLVPHPPIVLTKGCGPKALPEPK